LLHVLRRLLELPWLVLLNWGNHFWGLWLWLGEIRRYYWLWPLMQADLYWMQAYGLKSPFTLSRRATARAELPEDLTVYGETPWTTLERIAQAAGLKAQDQVFELGCGTGRTLLFFYYWYGCQVRGYELVPEFVEIFASLNQKLAWGQDVEMHQQNWFEADLSPGSFFFLVGSCYSDQHLLQAARQLAQVRPGSTVVTVSCPLPAEDFELQSQFLAPFSWGRATVYIHRRRQHAAPEK